jgi:hypothetical protein
MHSRFLMRTLLGLILGFGLQFGWVETHAQTPPPQASATADY